MKSKIKGKKSASASYTWDIFSTLDGFGSYSSRGNWSGYWGKQGAELLKRRFALYGQEAADGLRIQNLSAIFATTGLKHG